MRIAQPAKPSTSHYSPAPTRQFWSDGPTEVKRGDSKQDEAIDEESFGYLDLHTIPTLIPRIDARGEVALMRPPVMLPPPVYKQGRTLVRASVEASKRFFIDVKPQAKVNISFEKLK
ncbi:hypothetical protein KUCAC02_026706 [Chaenocephalus aceratus]|nr:hypothetical protein KUCAC02_026706 [Chaenocephalus aceratus]